MSFLAKFKHNFRATDINAGWSSPVARQAHNLKVVGSNPTPATNIKKAAPKKAALYMCEVWYQVIKISTLRENYLSIGPLFFSQSPIAPTLETFVYPISTSVLPVKAA